MLRRSAQDVKIKRKHGEIMMLNVIIVNEIVRTMMILGNSINRINIDNK